MTAILFLVATMSAAVSGGPYDGLHPLSVGGANVSKADFVERASRIFVKLDTKRNGFIGLRQASNEFGGTTSRDIKVPFFLRPASFSQIDVNHDHKITRKEYLVFASYVYDQADVTRYGRINLSDPATYERLVRAIH